MKKIFLYAAAALAAVSLLGGCSSGEGSQINVGVLKGPTGIGAVELMKKSSEGKTEGNYNISVANAADEINGKIAKGELDIAAVPTNVAPVLYNKDNGAYSVLAVNTLGVLYVLENGNTINSVSDLSGKTVYMAGQGAVPEYVMEYILEENGIDDTEIVFMTEHAEAAAALADGRADIVVLPEPNVTAVMMQNENARIALDLTEEWKAVSGNDMAMGCIIARKDFIDFLLLVFCGQRFFLRPGSCFFVNGLTNGIRNLLHIRRHVRELSVLPNGKQRVGRCSRIHIHIHTHHFAFPE